mgnify:CR=1 FL=1
MRLALPRIGLLPATLAVAALVLPLRLTALWQDLATLPAALAVAEAAAGEAAAAAPAPAAGSTTASALSGALSGALPTGRDAAAQAATPGPVPLTQAEIDLLQKLAERRETLDARERELALREGLLQAAEQQLQAKTAELTALQAKIEAAMRKQTEEQEKKIADLVSVYEKMKPKDAARIFNELDLDLLVDILGRMKDAKTAPILAGMEEDRARAVTTRLAERHAQLRPAQ